MQTARDRIGNARRRIPAFSLVELLAVIAIMAVLMAVAVPVFTDPANSARANQIVIRNQHGVTIFNELRDL